MRAIAEKLLTAIKGFCGGRQHLDNDGRIEQDIAVLVVKQWLAAHHGHIGVRKHPFGRALLLDRRAAIDFYIGR